MLLFAGSYTQEVGPGLSGVGDGIYTYQFNDETGELGLLHTFSSRNTSYVAVSNNGKFLYSFQEVSQDLKPVVLAFQINEDKSLTLLNEQKIDGSLPCHLSLLNNDKNLAIACYGSGSVHLFSLNTDGTVLPAEQNIYHKGKSVNKERQEAAHAHMIALNNKEVFVPDLGIDAIVNYAFSENKLVENYKIPMPLGTGVRHIVFHPLGNYSFVMNELTGEVSVLKKIDGKFQVNETINSLPNNYVGIPSGAAIQISRDGKFVYVSNRGSETIAIFEFDEEKGKMRLIAQQETFGKTPRDFSISPNDKWLIVANQDSNNIIVFKRDNQTGLLTKKSENKQTKSVVCLKWM